MRYAMSAHDFAWRVTPESATDSKAEVDKGIEVVCRK
jgi:hypothetical protein